MKKFTRIVGLVLALSMLLSIVVLPTALADDRRNIVIGLWWDMYYDSFDESWESNPSASGKDTDIMMFDVVKEIEEKYNVTIEYQNLTYQGVKDSLTDSVMAGAPDCDIYMVELGWGMPAVANGLAVNLHDVLPEDDPLFTHDDIVLNYVDIGDGVASLLTIQGAEDAVGATMPLAFNKQMLEEANLEDPRELVKRGEWTWDVFREYCKTLTKDLDGDGVTDVYGYGAWTGDCFPQWLMSNGTYVAATATENFSSPEVGEVLKFMQDMYLVDQSFYPIPEENGWDICRWLYRDKKVAFTTTACWILSNYDDYNYDGKNPDGALDFDMVFVDYPIGPSGNAETNAKKVAAGSFYLIPTGVEDPQLVYNVFRDLHNWYHDDTSIRDDEDALEWWYTATAKDLDLQDWNFEVMNDMGQHVTVDFIAAVIDNLELREFLEGAYTPSQLQESKKQIVQDTLDQLFGN